MFPYPIRPTCVATFAFVHNRMLKDNVCLISLELSSDIAFLQTHVCILYLHAIMLRNYVCSVSRLSKISFILNNMMQRINNYVSKVWDVLHDLLAKRGKWKYPSYFLKGMNKVTDNQQIANEINSYFSNVATKLISEHI